MNYFPPNYYSLCLALSNPNNEIIQSSNLTEFRQRNPLGEIELNIDYLPSPEKGCNNREGVEREDNIHHNDQAPVFDLNQDPPIDETHEGDTDPEVVNTPTKGERAGIKMNGNGESGLYSLPEDIIIEVLSLTTPHDACQLSLVSKLFHSAAGSDTVWDKFLPSDYLNFVAQSINPLLLPDFPSTKDLFIYLSNHPFIIDGGDKSFSLDKSSGKKCYMLAARNLDIIGIDEPDDYWRWTPLPDSRFGEVAELLYDVGIVIYGNINTSLLSPDTNYAAYLVYKFTDDAYGFDLTSDYNTGLPAEVSVGIIGEEIEPRFAVLENYGRDVYNYVNIEMILMYSEERKDGWLEIELGEYFNFSDEEVELEMSLIEEESQSFKKGLMVQGIEIRPKEGRC